jgi:hypothetical protein
MPLVRRVLRVQWALAQMPLVVALAAVAGFQ